MRLVSAENCDEGGMVGIQQLEYVGARGKNFPGNLNGFLTVTIVFLSDSSARPIGTKKIPKSTRQIMPVNILRYIVKSPFLRDPRFKVHIAAEFST